MTVGQGRWGGGGGGSWIQRNRACVQDRPLLTTQLTIGSEFQIEHRDSLYISTQQLPQCIAESSVKPMVTGNIFHYAHVDPIIYFFLAAPTKSWGLVFC